ncbi:hypothetical protein [Peterkaempfera bronchialis]|uniref:hypothetical protein n=1 Tax=Peterkaempfera bronchialis TaxID=2126346 RepID=UPI003C30B2F8
MASFYEDSPPLRQQHSADRSFYLFLDEHSWSGDLPGPPQVLAVHVQRQPGRGLALVEHSFEAMVPLAQRWLLARGADRTALDVSSGIYARPASEATLLAEERLRTLGRYEVLDHFTYDWEPSPAWVLALDRHEHDPDLPYRVFHRDFGPYQRNAVGFLQPSPDAASYSVTEHAFRTLNDVEVWTRATDRHWTDQDPGLRLEVQSFDRSRIAEHAVPQISDRAAAATTGRALHGSSPVPAAPNTAGEPHHRRDRPAPRH